MNERYILVAKSSGNRGVIDNALAGVEKHPVVLYEVNHVAGTLALVEAGMSVAAVSRLSLSHDHPTLVGVPLANPAVRRTLGLISKHGHIMRPAARTLFDMPGLNIKNKPSKR
ncbi:hypothetical protein GTP46_28220 [Duganella sp. FT135W]|uniref:LysR substrate-binding domain-containing protein n=1 Tax=Duganella flavida TaxID=2692175 RepID=A0A6L8KID7_9BURK|nr:hypothetical protein [Duganella flavida]